RHQRNPSFAGRSFLENANAKRHTVAPVSLIRRALCVTFASPNPMKAISILGCTGSIGTHTLAVVRAFPERFRVVGLSAGNDAKGLAGQIEIHRPRRVSVASESTLK